MSINDSIITSGSASYYPDHLAKLIVHPTRGEFRVQPRQWEVFRCLHRHFGEIVPPEQIIVVICGITFLVPLFVILIIAHNAPLGHEDEGGFVYDHRE